MCKTCKGEGGLAIDNGYWLHFVPCPDTNCDFEYDDSDIKELEERIKASETV